MSGGYKLEEEGEVIALTHFVLVKLNNGESCVEIQPRAKELLSRCVGVIDGFEAAEVHINCFEREQNYDLMLEMQMKNDQTLKEYLPHRLHKEFVEYLAPKAASKVTFDRE